MSYPSTPDPDPAPSLVTIGRAAKKATLGARTQVIVPVGGDAHSLSEQVGALASCYADIVEWRADTYLASLVGSHFVAASEVADDLVRMARYVADASPLPVLATIRTSVEGGEAFLDDEEYCALVRALAPLVGGVDVEISRDGAPALIEDAHAAGSLVIGSFHDFDATPSDDQLAEVLADMNYAGADVLKFACMATSATDAARVIGVGARGLRPSRHRHRHGPLRRPHAPGWIRTRLRSHLRDPSGERGQCARPVHHRAGPNGPRHHRSPALSAVPPSPGHRPAETWGACHRVLGAVPPSFPQPSQPNMMVPRKCRT